MAAPLAPTGAANVTTAQSGSSVTSLAASKPSGLADGDLLMGAYFNRTVSLAPTAPTGWTQYQIDTTNGTFGVWGLPVPTATGQPSTYTWTVTSANRCLLALWRVTGAALFNPLDSTGALSVNTGTTSVIDPAATAVSNTALLIAVNTANTTTATASAFTPPTGMTGLADFSCTTGAATSSMEIAAQGLTVSGSTGTRTATISPAAANSAGFLVTIAPSILAGPIVTVTRQAVSRASTY